jgi:hypothetical protein
VEAQFGNEAELKRQAAMEKALLGQPVPGVRPPDAPLLLACMQRAPLAVFGVSSLLSEAVLLLTAPLFGRWCSLVRYART